MLIRAYYITFLVLLAACGSGIPVPIIADSTTSPSVADSTLGPSVLTVNAGVRFDAADQPPIILTQSGDLVKQPLADAPYKVNDTPTTFNGQVNN